MTITRQQFLFAAALFIFALPVYAQSTRLALVGTYTTKTQSKGIYALDFDSATGKISPVRLAAETPDPSWVVIHPNGGSQCLSRPAAGDAAGENALAHG